jgi:hypothetical protein
LDVEDGYWQLILTGAGTGRRLSAGRSTVIGYAGAFCHRHTAIARQSRRVGNFVRRDGSVAR